MNTEDVIAYIRELERERGEWKKVALSWAKQGAEANDD